MHVMAAVSALERRFFVPRPRLSSPIIEADNPQVAFPHRSAEHFPMISRLGMQNFPTSGAYFLTVWNSPVAWHDVLQGNWGLSG